jgi:hypothetical protein
MYECCQVFDRAAFRQRNFILVAAGKLADVAHFDRSHLEIRDITVQYRVYGHPLVQTDCPALPQLQRQQGFDECPQFNSSHHLNLLYLCVTPGLVPFGKIGCVAIPPVLTNRTPFFSIFQIHSTP